MTGDPFRRPEHIYGVFIALAGLIKSYWRKKMLVTFHDLKWPWRHDERVAGRNILTQNVKSTGNPMFQSVSNGFRPKEAPFIFLPLTNNGRVAKLTWTKVTGIKIQRNTFHRYRYGYKSLKVSRWSVIRCSYDEHSNIFWDEVTWRDLVTWP